MAQGTDPVTGRPATPPIDTTQTSTNPAVIADDIRETRAEMDETIDALSAKLDPSHLIDQAKDAITSSAKDAGSSMVESFKDSSFLDTIKDNPIPAAAVGLSVAWFLSKMGESETDRYRAERYRVTGDPYYAPRRRTGYGTSRFDVYDQDRYYSERRYAGMTGDQHDESLADKASDALDTAKDKASDAVDTVKDKASHLADSARDALSGSGDAARDRAHRAGQQIGRYERRAESWLDRQMTANPLAIGAVALAAGALVGLSVPETDVEHRAFGDEADSVKRQLADTASNKADQLKSAAEDVAETVGEKAQSVADKAAQKGKGVVDDAASRAKSVAGEAKGTAKKAANKATSKPSSTSKSSSTPKSRS